MPWRSGTRPPISPAPSTAPSSSGTRPRRSAAGRCGRRPAGPSRSRAGCSPPPPAACCASWRSWRLAVRIERRPSPTRTALPTGTRTGRRPRACRAGRPAPRAAGRRTPSGTATAPRPCAPAPRPALRRAPRSFPAGCSTFVCGGDASSSLSRKTSPFQTIRLARRQVRHGASGPPRLAPPPPAARPPVPLAFVAAHELQGRQLHSEVLDRLGLDRSCGFGLDDLVGRLLRAVAASCLQLRHLLPEPVGLLSALRCPLGVIGRDKSHGRKSASAVLPPLWIEPAAGGLCSAIRSAVSLAVVPLAASSAATLCRSPSASSARFAAALASSAEASCSAAGA